MQGYTLHSTRHWLRPPPYPHHKAGNARFTAKTPTVFGHRSKLHPLHASREAKRANGYRFPCHAKWPGHRYSPAELATAQCVQSSPAKL